MRSALERNPFGLSGVFFTHRSMAEVLAGAARSLRTGRILVNAPPAVIPPGAPWGGYRRSGSSGPRDLLEAFADVVYLEEGAVACATS
jgi:acyl-CoA reductase-like NAD-dependent aldehyde dehydrogenase